MDPRFTDLKSTTFSGRRLTRRQIADIQKTVALFPNHSRNELAKTLCEHLNWVSAKGDYRVGACMKLLEALERHGILTLPPKREAQVRDMTSGPVWTSASDRRPALCADLSDLRPLRLEPVTDTDGRQLWNAFVDRHHYLGYRRPFGAHIRYFVADREGRKLGCLLFEAATKTLPCRDNWIGWSDRARGRSRHLMVVNSRFLVFSLGALEESRVLGPRPGDAPARRRLAAPAWLPPRPLRDVRRRDPVQGLVLPRRQLGAHWLDRRTVGQGGVRAAVVRGRP